MKIIFSVCNNSEINANAQMVLKRKYSIMGKSLNLDTSSPEYSSPAMLC